MFAQVLRESLRTEDLVCRHGGEEFAIAIPGCGIDKSREIFEAARIRLEAAMAVAGLPKFTVSFGVIEADPKDDLPTSISRADAALFRAKREGRDRVVVLDADGQEAPITNEPSDASSNGNGRVLNGRDGLELSSDDLVVEEHR
jgi:PleD family two-component response regulator